MHTQTRVQVQTCTSVHGREYERTRDARATARKHSFPSAPHPGAPSSQSPATPAPPETGFPGSEHPAPTHLAPVPARPGPARASSRRPPSQGAQPHGGSRRRERAQPGQVRTSAGANSPGSGGAPQGCLLGRCVWESQENFDARRPERTRPPPPLPLRTQKSDAGNKSQASKRTVPRRPSI